MDHLLPGDLLRGCGLRAGCLPLHALRLQLCRSHRHAPGKVLNNGNTSASQRSQHQVLKRKGPWLLARRAPNNGPALRGCKASCRRCVHASTPKEICGGRQFLLVLHALQTPPHQWPPLHRRNPPATSPSSRQMQEELLPFPSQLLQQGQHAISNGKWSLATTCTGWVRRSTLSLRVAHIPCMLDVTCTMGAEGDHGSQSRTFAGSGLCDPDIDAMPAVRWQVCRAHIGNRLDSPRPPAEVAMRTLGRSATHLGGHAGKDHSIRVCTGCVRGIDLWQLAARLGHLIRSVAGATFCNPFYNRYERPSTGG